MHLPSTTLEERIRRVRADINAALPGADAGIARAPEYALGKALSAAVHGLQGLAEWIAAERVPGPDSSAETLEMWLNLFRSPRKQPESATGTIRITGTVTTIVAAATAFQLADGTEMTTDAQVTITDHGGGNIHADAAVTATLPGSAGNADVGTVVRLVSPLSGVDSEATVQDDGSGAGLSGGTDLESRDEMWSRLQQRVSSEPATGAENDYVRWAREVAGVTRAWAEGGALGAGTVRVFFVRDGESPIIPSAGEVATVQAYIDTVAPVTANVTVAAPTAVVRNFTITGITDLTARANITAQLTDYILRESEPGVTLQIEAIIGSIAIAVGSAGFGLTSPSADVTHAATEIPTMGTITWA